MSVGVLPSTGELRRTGSSHTHKAGREGKPNSSSVLKCSLVWEKERHYHVKDQKKMWSVGYFSPFILLSPNIWCLLL